MMSTQAIIDYIGILAGAACQWCQLSDHKWAKSRGRLKERGTSLSGKRLETGDDIE